MTETTYLPLTRAIQTSGLRISDALTALSVAEIRPILTSAQLQDTVEELRSAVGESISMHQLFILELNRHDQDVLTSRDTIRSLSALRSASLKKSDARAYQSLTLQILDATGHARLLVPPSMAACMLVSSSTVNIKEQSDLNPVLDPELNATVKRRYKRRNRATS